MTDTGAQTGAGNGAALRAPPRTGIPFTDAQRVAWLRLHRTERVGPATFRELINQFGTADAALAALPGLARRGGGRPVTVPAAQAIETEIARTRALGARFLAMGEPGYPPWLVHGHAPPPVLTLRGSADLLARRAVAIVGARNGSAAGRKVAGTLARDLGANGVLVVSGFARGIDAAAHGAAAATGTAAVFAGGIDVIYPPEHDGLLARILDGGGCAVTEMPFGWTPRAKDFPRRNRIIAGIAVATVVIEAAKRSGTLITARRALEQNREVMAVPGSPLDPRSVGTNDLIKNGARCVTSADDVLEAIAAMTEPAVFREEADPPRHDTGTIADPPPRPTFRAGTDSAPGLALDPPRDAREIIVEALGPAPVEIDDLIRQTGIPSRQVAVVLLELDLAGRLHRHPGNRVSVL